MSERKKTIFLCVKCAHVGTMKYSLYTQSCAAGIAQSVPRLATGWTVQGSNPGGG